MSDIATRVKKIIVDKLGVDEAEVTNEASFTNDLGADSLDTVELIMEFEKEFNISIPDEQAETITILIVRTACCFRIVISFAHRFHCVKSAYARFADNSFATAGQ